MTFNIKGRWGLYCLLQYCNLAITKWLTTNLITPTSNMLQKRTNCNTNYHTKEYNQTTLHLAVLVIVKIVDNMQTRFRYYPFCDKLLKIIA